MADAARVVLSSQVEFPASSVKGAANPVNATLARLEGANKIYRTRILVGDRTRELAHGTVLFREIDRVRVVGREAPVTLFEPVGAASAVAPDVVERVAAFGAATTFRPARYSMPWQLSAWLGHNHSTRHPSTKFSTSSG